MSAVVVDGRQRWQADTVEAAWRWAVALAAATGHRVRVVLASDEATASGGRR